ncbi:uncharacterized protein LOC115876311 isoform X2 [Sitophilus oryzae]|uniref:Uncharacterized protein LOC115876311 isoform X2 n=1 Tax=Sitophilus oryzae TaxID=7048 RepID=A0A6J2X9P0_SITOR|nr:uncharacterized protein LOC115876311 isoform X2 [Sitophilus oryzae]
MSNPGNDNNQPNVDLSKPPPGYPRAYRRTGYSWTDYQNSSNQSTGRGTPNNRQTPNSYNRYAENSQIKLEKDVSKPGSSNATFNSANQSNFQNGFYANYLLQPPPPPPPTDSTSSSAKEAPSPNPSQNYYSDLYNTLYAAPPRSQTAIGARPTVSPKPAEEYKGQYNRKYKGYYNYNRSGRNYYPYTKNRQTAPKPHEPLNKGKKKKPLSQSMPSTRGWTLEQAKRALAVETEYNRRHKSQSLIVKFPDKELNREIVSKLHGQIDHVYFQLPCTPRFCFVTLKEDANVGKVMEELNQIKFGDGYLTVEPKKDREEDLRLGPEDIDPLTLYVGNLAQEVTVEKVHKAYPKNKRVDIGFAKKMKYTRYAFVSFHTVDDAIEAFQKTRAEEMYAKTIIVRFRRLHGTVGLPGEPKPQNTKKNSPEGRAATSHEKKNPFDDLFGFKEEQPDPYEEDAITDFDSLNLLASAPPSEFDRVSVAGFPDSLVPEAEPVSPEPVLAKIKTEPLDDEDMAPADHPDDAPLHHESDPASENIQIPFIKKEEDIFDDKSQTIHNDDKVDSPDSLQHLLRLLDDEINPGVKELSVSSVT